MQEFTTAAFKTKLYIMNKCLEYTEQVADFVLTTNLKLAQQYDKTKNRF